MMKAILKISAVSLLAAAIAGLPLQVPAQTTNKPAAATKVQRGKSKTPPRRRKPRIPSTENWPRWTRRAKTIKVGESIYQITSETKITKAGKPATLDRRRRGRGSRRLCQADRATGRWPRRSVRFGPKVDDKARAADKKKDTTPKSSLSQPARRRLPPPPTGLALDAFALACAWVVC